MFKNIENIKLIYCRLGKRTNCKILKNRKYHLLAIGVAGNRKFCFEDRVITAGKGSLVFVPHGSSYEYKPEDKEFVSVTITFDADIPNPKPQVYDISNYPGFYKTVKNFPKLWQNKPPSYKHQCLSMFHSLIAYLIETENVKYSDKRKITLIEPALNYIDTNLADTNLKPGNLPHLCGISPAYFRKLFISNLGMTPQKYIEEKRLHHAMSVLETQGYITVSELANLSGYKDPLYFGKVFKKKYGVSPSYFKNFW